MTDSSHEALDAQSDFDTGRPRWLFRRIEVVIVILLGLVSFATAYTSFEASLYGGNSSTLYSKGNNNETEAESLYLEANQQYMQDAQTIASLAELKVAADSGDEIAQKQYDELYFISVSDDLDKAIKKADKANAADPTTYTSPLDDKKYQAVLFGDYADKANSGHDKVKRADVDNGYGDRLTLNTVLMALTLFLLGVAAVVRRPHTKIILAAFGMTIFTAAAVLTALIPFTWL
jgi:hypothetical protein